MRKTLFMLAAFMFAMASCKAGSAKAESESATADSLESANSQSTETTMPNDSNSVKVAISTSMGDITVLLYGDTPKHRDNFVKLVKENYYDGTLFHRVINEFMIQAGDPDSKTAKPGQQLGSGGPGYQIDAEINYPTRFHKRGALAAARTGDQINPERRSSGSQFYIVTGQKYAEPQLAQLESQLTQMQIQGIFQQLVNENRDKIMAMQREGDNAGLQQLQNEFIATAREQAAANPTKLTEEQRKAYSTVGGAPHLDGQYTVFGEVISGMEVVDKIEKVETDRSDRPKDDVKILSMKIIE